MATRIWWNLYQALAWVLYRNKPFVDDERRFPKKGGRETWVAESFHRGGVRQIPHEIDGHTQIELVVACEKPWSALDEAVQREGVSVHRFRDGQEPLPVSAEAWAAHEFGSWRDAERHGFLFRPKEVVREFPAPLPPLGTRASAEQEVLRTLKALFAEREKVKGESREALWPKMASWMEWPSWALVWKEAAACPDSRKSWSKTGPGKTPRG